MPLVGLAIDGSITFWAKAKLSAAVDAAALAAGRNVNMAETTAQNSGPVVTVAQQWFAANFPTGWMGATVTGPSVTYVTTSASYQQVTVTASASVPLYFLRLIGMNTVTMSASAQSSRRNSFIVLVLDRSGSMGPPPLGTNACPIMKQDAINFVNKFTENFDSMALVTYSTSSGPSPDFGPSTSFKAGMAAAINNITCTGATSTAQGLNVAYNTIKASNLAGALNVVVLFTDGQPNLLVAQYPIKTSADTRYGLYPPTWGTNDPYTVLRNYPPSTCNTSQPLLGGLTTLVDASNPQPPGVQGMTGGLYDETTQVSPSSDNGLIGAPGCGFTQIGNIDARADVAYIPIDDYYGNPTNTGYGTNPPYYGTVGAPDTFTTGPYAGQIRPDEQTTGIMAAAINAADYQAQVILNDSTYNTAIYTIGLQGAGDMPIDETLLQRIANDPRSSIYKPAAKTGLYVTAPTPAQLDQAFTLVASQILRLSK